MRRGWIVLMLVGMAVLVTGCPENSGVVTSGVVTSGVGPDGKVDHLLRGNEYADQGAVQQAETEYAAAIMENRFDTRAYVNLGQLYINTNQTEKAERVLLKAVELNPRETRGYNLLGHIYFSRRPPEYNKARYFYAKAVDINPSYYEAHWNLASACRQLGQDADAAQHYERYLELAPASEGSHLQEARNYVRDLKRQ